MSEFEASMERLNAAFNDVAQAIQAELPAIWDAAVEAYGVDDSQTLVTLLAARNAPGFGGKSLVEVAKEHGEQSVIDYLGAVAHGVYV
ncbi:MAG: hypothetical protein ACK4VI_09465 [Alphaproteobacteria bacterium]